jgi:hypothetical protein
MTGQGTMNYVSTWSKTSFCRILAARIAFVYLHD